VAEVPPCNSRHLFECQIRRAKSRRGTQVVGSDSRAIQLWSVMGYAAAFISARESPILSQEFCTALSDRAYPTGGPRETCCRLVANVGHSSDWESSHWESSGKLMIRFPARQPGTQNAGQPQHRRPVGQICWARSSLFLIPLSASIHVNGTWVPSWFNHPCFSHSSDVAFSVRVMARPPPSRLFNLPTAPSRARGLHGATSTSTSSSNSGPTAPAHPRNKHRFAREPPENRD
jgi:hypothetical protein